MHILNGKRINPLAPYTDSDGTRYSDLSNIDVCQKLGVQIIDEPPPPEGYDPRLYDKQELEDPPYVVYRRKDDFTIQRNNIIANNAVNYSYLQQTDWYIIRLMDNGTPVPDDVKAARQAARDGILPVPDFVGTP